MTQALSATGDRPVIRKSQGMIQRTTGFILKWVCTGIEYRFQCQSLLMNMKKRSYPPINEIVYNLVTPQPRNIKSNQKLTVPVVILIIHIIPLGHDTVIIAKENLEGMGTGVGLKTKANVRMRVIG